MAKVHGHRGRGENNTCWGGCTKVVAGLDVLVRPAWRGPVLGPLGPVSGLVWAGISPLLNTPGASRSGGVTPMCTSARLTRELK